MIYLFFERDSKTAQARQIATYDSATVAWDGERVQMLQDTLSDATFEGQEPDIAANPDQLLKIFSGSRVWAVSENGVATKHLRGTPQDHDQSTHAGDRGSSGPTKAEYAAWEKMSPKERSTKWNTMDEVARDKFNSPSTTIQQALMGEAAQFGPWKQASWDQALKARLKDYNDYIPEDTKGLILDRMLEAEVIFRNAGASPEQARSLMEGMTDALAAQEHESLGRQLGDHGIRHLLGDEVMAQEILMLHPAEDTPQQRAALMLAAVYHDTGYLTPSGRLMFGEDHPRTSTVHFNANLKGEVKTALGSEVANNISEMIATHDSAEIDWAQPGVTALRLADNLSLFHKEKLPGLFKYVPANIDTLTRLGSGKVSVDAAKVEMRNNIANANLPNRVRDALYRAADEVNPLTAKTTIGRLNGEITGFNWVGESGGYLRVEMSEGTSIPAEVFAQLDMGRKQFDKFAKAYGLDPMDLWDDNQFTVSMGTVTLLEGYISPAIKALLDALIIPVKHLPGQHDQDSHGSWAEDRGTISIQVTDIWGTGDVVLDAFGGEEKVTKAAKKLYAVPGHEVEVTIEPIDESGTLDPHIALRIETKVFTLPPESPDSAQSSIDWELIAPPPLMDQYTRFVGRSNDTLYLAEEDSVATFYAAGMEFTSKYQGQGLAKEMVFNKLALAQELGMDSFEFSAGGTVGVYAWAKYGASYKESNRAHQTGISFRSWAFDQGFPEPSTGWPEFKTPYDVATYKHPEGHTFTTPDNDQYNRAVPRGVVYDLGKAFMLDLRPDGHRPWDAVVPVSSRGIKMIISVKHQPGQHDQDSHGSWAQQAPGEPRYGPEGSRPLWAPGGDVEYSPSAVESARYILQHSPGDTPPDNVEKFMDQFVLPSKNATFGDWATEVLSTQEPRRIAMEAELSAASFEKLKKLPSSVWQSKYRVKVVPESEMPDLDPQALESEWGISPHAIRPAQWKPTGTWELEDGGVTIYISEASENKEETFWHEFAHVGFGGHIQERLIGPARVGESAGDYTNRFARVMADPDFDFEAFKHQPGNPQHDQASHGSWARGRSLPQVPKAISQFEKNFAQPSIFSAPEEAVNYLRYENGCAVNANGELKWEGTSGLTDKITLPRHIWVGLKDGTFSHNHPPERATLSTDEDGDRAMTEAFDLHSISQPPSSTDMVTAAFYNLQEMRVIGYRDSKAIVFRVIRPASGKWPEELTEPSYYGEKMRKVHGEVTAANPQYSDPFLAFQDVDISDFSYKVLTQFWTEAANELGFIYKEEEWKSS